MFETVKIYDGYTFPTKKIRKEYKNWNIAQKKEAALVHYLSPNQIKPNYLSCRIQFLIEILLLFVLGVKVTITFVLQS